MLEGVSVPAHRRARQPLRIRKAVGVLAITGVIGAGVAVFEFMQTSPDRPAPTADAGEDLGLAPTPDTQTPSALPESVAPTASPTAAPSATPTAPLVIVKSAADGSIQPASPRGSTPSPAKPSTSPVPAPTT